jgi:nitrite reductase/ring-hydroxylating ferredoxin subunit
VIEMARRNIAHVKAGTIDQEPDVYRIPAAAYFDPERGKIEMERIFKRLPLLLGFSAELRERGAYRALEVVGVPILLIRGGDGEVRAFVNMCTHRGARLVDEGSGKALRFACPYHAWTFDDYGQLASILDEKDFGEVDHSCLGLTQVPTAERAGLIFGVVTPGAELDIDAFLCGYDEMLAHLAFDKCHLVGRQSFAGPNWKICYDGYLDFYHLPILHRASFGPDMPNKALYDRWGPHQHVSMPNPQLLKFEDQGEEAWDLETMLAGVWTIFPHVSIASFDAGGKVYMVSQLFPGATSEESVTIQNFLADFEPDEEHAPQVTELMAFLKNVVQGEDYEGACFGIQKAVKTGAISELLFGRNEGGGQCFHSWVDAVTQTADEDLGRLFERGIGMR